MDRRDVLVVGLLSAGLMVVMVPIASLGVNAHHDGIMLKPALDVLAGQVLFRDTFTQYGALTTYLQAVALWIQPSLLSLRFMTVAAYTVTLFFLYVSWRLILPRSLSVVSCGLYVLFIPCYEKDWLDQYWTLLPWSSVFAMMFQSVALYALLQLIRGRQAARWGAVLGLTCACVFWCRQPVGVIMAGCVAVIWLALDWTDWAPAGVSKRSTFLGMIGGFGAVHAVLLGGILLSGGGAAWWYQNIVWPSQWVGTVPLTWHQFITVFVHPAAAAWLLAVLLAAAIPRLVWRIRPEASPWLMLAFLLCLGGVLVWQYERVLQALALRHGGWTALFPLVVLLQAIVSLALGFGARGKTRTTEYHLVAALAALSLGSLLQYFPLPDPWHILWSLAPAFGLCVFAFWRWLAWPAPAVALLLAALFLPSVYAVARSARDSLSRPMVTLTAPAVLRGMKVSPDEAHRFGQITNTIDLVLKHRPDIPGAMIGNDALVLCFLPNRANPLPYYVNWPGLADLVANQQRWRYIEIARPLMFFCQANWEAVNDFYRRARYVPLLYVPEEAMEIAVPQEVADAMGVTVYGAALEHGTANQISKP